MSDSRNNPPPDDWAKTRQNIKLPESENTGASDWDKTNYNFPKQPEADEWGKTVMNIKPIDTSRADYGKTIFPGAGKQPEGDWTATHVGSTGPDTDFASAPSEAYGKTTPYFQLPEAERAKYQSLPLTPAEQAAKEAEEKKAKGGIPGWVWIAVGGLLIFGFFLVVLAGVGVFFLWGNSNFDATVRSAPPGSDVLVDDVPWGVTSEDGSIRLSNLRAGRRTIKITHPNFTCEPREVTVEQPSVIARCQAVAKKATDDCANILPGEEDKAERCYYAALAALPDPFTPEQLVKALSILVINFGSGSYEVPAKRLAALQKGAEYIRRVSPPDTVLEVGGHTDSDGNAAGNKTLSQNRAEAVKKVLVGYGVRPETLQTRGYGPDKPVADNATDVGKFRNRRIEYLIVKK
ncbi:MAG TPA: OmpA family protein [Pyrinomonadaceae bacterium]|nr:OmpA family protein [Pyrinomonadaceae bacterium]